MGALQALRLVMIAVVVLAGALAPRVAGASTGRLLPLVAGYAALQVAAELAHRLARGRGLAIVAAMLLADGAFVVAVLYRTGGPASYLAFLVELHLIAVSLLVSYRTGLKLALWYTLLFSIGHELHAAGLIPADETGRSVVAGFGGSEVFGILAFWLVAIATAVFSSLNERELRRSKIELRALAAMTAGLTEDLRAERVPALLLESLLTTFGLPRGAVIIAADASVSVTTIAAASMQAETSVRATTTDPWPDAVAIEAATRRAPVLVRGLGADDPVLASALAGARNVIVLPLLAGGAVLGVVALERRGAPSVGVSRRTLEVLGQFAAHAAQALHTADLHAEVRRLATTDSLTGLATRRVFDEALDREAARAVRRGGPLAVVLIDVDRFKMVNDNFGHQTGDAVLQRVGCALRSEARESDVVARFGGEEFVMLLPDCDADDAALVAERVRRAVGSGMLASPASPASVTVSAGVAVRWGDGIERDALVRQADGALYRAKRAGRDRVIVAASEPTRLA
jgi:diguanylate cyclase (GGDEF)-like protein